MNRTQALRMDNGQFFHALDDGGMIGVYGIESGYCYALCFDSAQAAGCERLIKTERPDDRMLMAAAE